MSKLNNDSYVCPVFATSGKCGEQDALRVMAQFKDFYEEKLSEIDVEGGGDCLELKLKVQRRWIDDLTEQTEMMARIVKELEDEATSRVRMLEDKLRQSSKSAYEVMKRYQTYSISHNLDEPFQKVFYLENDLKNVLEFLRRVRDDRKWSIEGLSFYDVSYKDLFGGERCDCDEKASIMNGSDKKEMPSKEENDEDTDGGVDGGTDLNQTIEDLAEQLKRKTEEYEELRRSMLDMRSALTEEVACKHDMISALKKDLQQLEERCLQADKQTAFKDDIIKELRKEIRQLKQQESSASFNGKQLLDESLRKIVAKLNSMTRKMRKFHLRRKETEGRMKILEEDNDNKNVLLNSLYKIIKGLLGKLAFGDDKIKEKEVDLTQQLEAARCKIEVMKPYVEMKSTCTGTCVEMKSAWTGMDDTLVINKSKLIRNKDDIIQIQNDTLNVIEIELQACRKREKDLEGEIGRRQKEVDDLKCRCLELEKSLSSSQGRAENLQKAVDLYLNSINVLEAAEEKGRIEIEQQKMTIINLQEALVNVKQELDELRENSQQEVQNYEYLFNVFYVNLIDLEERNANLDTEMTGIIETHKKLQDSNFELEVEHFNTLQDLAILETQLYKYQSEFRSYEEAKCSNRCELKKLHQQNRYYRQVIDCFKTEMTVMSEQLIHLQEILNLSNQSCREENGQLYTAVIELQKQSEKLQAQLIDTEKKALIENQKNQLKDAQIDELQLIIGQKNADLNVHDEAINEMKIRLENTQMENHDLQATIVSLNSQVMQMQCCLQNREIEKARKRCKSKSVTCKRSQSDCRRNECDLELDTCKSIQQELERIKQKNKEKIKNLKRQNDELKEKLATSDLSNKHLIKELTQLKDQTLQINEREFAREHELAQSKQIIIELRQTLIELNESLAETELHHMALAEEFQNAQNKENHEQEDVYLSIRCEIALYKKLADNFKDALLGTRKKLVEVEARNWSLNEELKNRDARINEIQKKAVKKEKENCHCIEGLKEKLLDSQAEEQRLSTFINDLKQEVQRKLEDKKETQNVVINCCECNDMRSTQEEINSLKIEIKNMIQNQLALNNENDKLLAQVTCLQNNVQSLEDKNRYLKQKLERIQTENQNLKEKNKAVLREKETFSQAIKNLEIELAETKNTRDDVCAESRHVVNNVKAWLEEQRKINDKVKKKTRCYCDTIEKLKQENETLLMGRPVASSTFKQRYERNYNRPCTPVDCSNMWCLGSQGTGSVLDSPRDSPLSCTCSVEEWYSPNYREDDETTEQEDDFINSIEAVTQEMRKKNSKWKNKYPEYAVSRDKN